MISRPNLPPPPESPFPHDHHRHRFLNGCPFLCAAVALYTSRPGLVAPNAGQLRDKEGSQPASQPTSRPGKGGSCREATTSSEAATRRRNCRANRCCRWCCGGGNCCCSSTHLPAYLLSLSLSRAAAHNQTSNESIVSREKSASQFYLLIRTIKTTRSVTRARSQVSFNIQLVELIACIRRRCQSVRVHRQREEEKPKGSTRNGANRSVSDSVPNERVRRLSPHS